MVLDMWLRKFFEESSLYIVRVNLDSIESSEHSNIRKQLGNMSDSFTSKKNSMFQLTGVNTSNNNNVSEVIPSDVLHPFTQSLELSVVFILLYSVTTFLAIVGNITAIIVFTKGKKSKTDLRPFLLNLAVSDLIMAIFCIPFTFTSSLLGTWVFSSPMCPIVVFLQTVSVTASVSTNMVVGIDRFNAITAPLKSHNIAPIRYRIIIFFIWIFAISLSAVQLRVSDTRYNNGTEKTECRENWDDDGWRVAYSIIVLVITYVLPLVILTITYSIVGCILWRRTVPGNADAVRDQAQIKSKKKVVKMLVTIVTFFGLCWLPLHTCYLVIDITQIEKYAEPDVLKTLGIVYFVAHWLAMSNSFVNPLIYGFMNDNFRADLRTLVFRYFPFSKKSTRTRHRVVKRRSRGNGYHLCSFATSTDFHHNVLQRSKTTCTKNGTLSTHATAVRTTSSQSC